MSFHFDDPFRTQLLHFVEAPCGSGKTTTVVHYISTKLHLQNYLYVAPTRELLRQVKAMMEQVGVKPMMISSDTHKNGVARAIVEYLKAALDSGHVLLITLEAYINIPFFPKRENWQVYIDEVPQVDTCHRFRLPRNMDRIANHVEVLDRVNNDVVSVAPKDAQRLEHLFDAVRDDLDEPLIPFFKHLTSDNHNVFVEASDWKRLVEKGQFSGRDDLNEITFVSMLNKKPFEGSVLMGANVRSSMLFDWLQRFHGLRTREFVEVSDQLREEPSNKRCQIHYFFEDVHFSKYLYQSTASDGSTLIDRMDREVVSLFREDDFLYVANNDRKSGLIDGLKNSKRIPVMSHGLNDYRDYINIYFSAALNRTPKHLKLLKLIAFPQDSIYPYDMIYQSVMRTALRNNSCDELVRMIVPDRFSAERSMDLIPGSRIQKIGNLDLVKRRSLTQTEKNIRYRSRKIRSKLLATKLVPDSFKEQSGTHIVDDNSLTCIVTTHEELKVFHASQCAVKTITLQEWIKDCRTMAKEPVDAKDQLGLFCPSAFDPAPGTEGYKRHEHFQRASFLVLDFDNGELTPDDFIEIFGHEERHSFLICNSYSRSPEQPNRFRVMMFFKSPARTVEQYRACFDYVAQRLRTAGFSPDRSKLDGCCRSPAQSYYLPGTNRDFPDHGIFQTYGTTTREIKRIGLDPHILEATRPKGVHPTDISQPGKFRWTENARSMQTTLKKLKEGRHGLQFEFAVELACHGAKEPDIREALKDCLGTDPRMKKKTDDSIKSLKRYGLLT